jgi:hypothetical protein
LQQVWRMPRRGVAAGCHGAFPRAEMGAVFLCTIRDGSRKPCAGPEALARASHGFRTSFSCPERGLMRRMRRIRRYHAEPLHNIPREPLGPGCNPLMLALFLPGNLVGMGYYAALRPSIYS